MVKMFHNQATRCQKITAHSVSVTLKMFLCSFQTSVLPVNFLLSFSPKRILKQSYSCAPLPEVDQGHFSAVLNKKLTTCLLNSAAFYRGNTHIPSNKKSTESTFL